MQRNLKVTFQVTLESELSDEALKANIIDAVIKNMKSIDGAEPEGMYLITVEPDEGGAFPKIPPAMTDLQVDRQREFEKEREQEERWKKR